MPAKILSILFLCLTFPYAVWAANVPASQQASGVEAGRDIQEKDLKLRQSLQKDRPSSGMTQEAPAPAAAAAGGEAVFVSRIEVTGASYVAASEVNAIVKSYENKSLTVADMQEVANKITDAYRQKGYITSRAILPQQKLESGVLKIQVIEASLGNVTVEGNKYFSTALIKRKVGLKSGEPFNYSRLQQNLTALNQVQDRKVRTVLTPGQNPGTTDLVLKVKDQLPIHVGLSYDNYGSRYLRKPRYQGSITHNNLLGFDDIMNVTYQTSEGHDTYRLSSLRYLFPFTNATRVGFYAGKSQMRLGKEFEPLEARGKSNIYSLYLTHNLYTDDSTELSVEAGFDYKDVYNFELGTETSRDRLRVGRLGVKLDKSDSLGGRTIINNEIDQGFPGRWGGLEKIDTQASRAGSGGRFTKDVLDVVRLQSLPLDATLLLKGEAQFASRALPSAEQFQVGGIANVRGYPSGEIVGDSGTSVTAELSNPFYFIPKSWNAPLSKAKLYDALRFATFYDWGQARLRSTTPGEEKTRNLSSVGCGLRYDLPESFSVRLDVAWPLKQVASDRDNVRTWLKVSKDF